MIIIHCSPPLYFIVSTYQRCAFIPSLPIASDNSLSSRVPIIQLVLLICIYDHNKWPREVLDVSSSNDQNLSYHMHCCEALMRAVDSEVYVEAF